MLMSVRWRYIVRDVVYFAMTDVNECDGDDNYVARQMLFII